MNRRREQHEEHIDESWLIPYADLLTLLLALFIVLFASSTIDAQKFNAMKESFNAAINGGSGIMDSKSFSEQFVNETSVRTEAPGELQKLKQQFDEAIAENNMQAVIETKITNNYLTLTIRDHALFDSGSAKVKSESLKIIEAMAGILEKYPHYEVLVAGHTDNRPINTRQFESNWDLSSARALNCMKILLANEKLDPRHFSAIGYSEYRPIVSNESEEGRTKNRRVEVTIKQTAVQQGENPTE